jgi:hypothetical protein
MVYKTGTQLRSQTCSTEVMVIRAGDGSVELQCGGYPMLADRPAGLTSPKSGLSGGTLLGKRYTTAAGGGFEVLVVKPGAGTLSDGDTPLVVKDAKPLPSSD